MNTLFKVPAFQLYGFAFCLFGFGLVSGFAIESPKHSVAPVVVMAVGLALTVAGLVKASRRVAA